jgi:hypothetical protein
MGLLNLPKRLPQNAGVELPESGRARVPPEKLRELFPEHSRLIDLGWEVWVSSNGVLLWSPPPDVRGLPENVCPLCRREAEPAGEHIEFGYSEWEYYVGRLWRCRACNLEWWV